MSDFKPVLTIPLLLTSTTTSRRIALIKQESTAKQLQTFAEREVKIYKVLQVLQNQDFDSTHAGEQTEAGKFSSETFGITKRATRI